MATKIGEKIIYIVNSNSGAMQNGVTISVAGTTALTVGAQSLATANWHASQWQVTPILYQADFGVNANFGNGSPVPVALQGTYGATCSNATAVDAVMRYHCTQVAALATPDVTHIICSSHTPGVVFSGKWSQFINNSGDGQPGEAFDAWFGAANYMKSGTGWTTGLVNSYSNDTLIVVPKRYPGCDPNYLPYGRIGHSGFGSFYTPTPSLNELLYEPTTITKRIITDAIANVGSDAIHKTKSLYTGWGTGGGSKSPSFGETVVGYDMATVRGYTNFCPYIGINGGYSQPILPGSSLQTGLVGVQATYPLGWPVDGSNQPVTKFQSAGVGYPETAGWAAQISSNPVWLLMDPYNWSNTGYNPTSTTGAWNAFQNNLAKGAFMLNQSSAGGVAGALMFLWFGGCLSQGTVSEPNAGNIVDFRYAMKEFLNGRTWAEANLVANGLGNVALGKMGVYGDPLAQHFKYNSAVWI